MAVFEKVVHGNLKDVIQNTDMLLKEGKHKLDFRDEYSMTSKGMDVTVRIYQRYRAILPVLRCYFRIIKMETLRSPDFQQETNMESLVWI